MTALRIGIVGAGISGLVSARTLLAQGHSVRVFERSAEIGGVWGPSRRYPGLRTQTARDSYAFSDFPMPAAYPEFPDGADVHRYLHACAQHHDLFSHIELRSDVTSVTRRQDGRPGWRMAIRKNGDGETADEFNFEVVVGFGTSALDIAEAAAGVASFCAIVCNRTLWKVPRFLLGGIRAKPLILSRFWEF